MANGFTEAPASWNIKYRTPDGFDAMLTLRGENGAELLPRAEQAVAWLLEHGAQPNGYHGNGNGGGQADTKTCPIHNTPMKRREKHGDVWYSHKAPDGSWCRGGENG